MTIHRNTNHITERVYDIILTNDVWKKNLKAKAQLIWERTPDTDKRFSKYQLAVNEMSTHLFGDIQCNLAGAELQFAQPLLDAVIQGAMLELDTRHIAHSFMNQQLVQHDTE